MATYNGERYLKEQLDSIANQTHLPLELIVSDDGSRDGTSEILDNFVISAPFPVRRFMNPGSRGYINNFMSAVTHVQGDLIAFSDQDDVWLPHKLAVMANLFKNEAVTFVYHNALVADVELVSSKLLYDAKSHQTALAVEPMHPWHHSFGFTQTFRSTLTKHDNLWPRSWDHNHDQKMAHDQWFIFLALLEGKVIFVEEALAIYRQHDANVVGVSKPTTFRERFNQFVHRDGKWEDRASRAALARSTIASAVCKGSGVRHADRIAAISRAYLNLGKQLSVRSSLYKHSCKTKKLLILLKLVSSGAYSMDHRWRFGWLSLFRDLMSCYIGR